jgi:DNA-binding NtrC family response regulator
MSPESAVLVIRGETDGPETIARTLADDFRVIEAERGDEALPSLLGAADVVILDLEGSQGDGLEVMKRLRSRQPAPPVLALAKEGDLETAIQAMKLGAADCLVKPADPERLRSAVTDLLQQAHQNGQQVESQNHPGAGQHIEIPPGTSLEDLERAAVEQALAQHNGNRTHAAKTLGISVRTLQRKLKAWGMPIAGSGNGPQSSSFILSPHNGGSAFTSNAH